MNALNPDAFTSSVSPVALNVVAFVPRAVHDIAARAAAIEPPPVSAPEEATAPAPAGWAVIEGGAETEAAPVADPVTDETPSEIAEVAQPAPAKRYAGQAVISRAALASALAMAKLVTERRNTIPILSNVLIRDVAGGVSVTATDLDIDISIHIPAPADEGFGVTMPTHVLESLFRKAPACDMVAIDVLHDDESAVLDFESVTYRVNSLPVDDFPTQYCDMIFAGRFTMAGSTFRDMLDSVQGVVSTEETRYYLNGVYLHAFSGGNQLALRAVATDGHRLYCSEIDAPEGAADAFPQGVIVPRRMVDLLLKLTKGKTCPETVTVESTKRHFRVSWGAVTVTSKLIDGTYPDYQRVIPTMNDKVATFDPKAMAEAIGAVTVMSSERGRAVRFTINDGSIRLDVNNPDTGSATTKIAAFFRKEGEPAEELSIGFNAKYMLDVLAEAGGDLVTAEMADPGSPTVFRGSRPGWLAVLMPMRV